MKPVPLAILLRLALALLPLAASLLLAWLLAGPLSLGGGEKDIVLAIPLLLFALVHLPLSLLFWWRGVAIGRANRLAAGYALLALVLILLLWLVLSWR